VWLLVRIVVVVFLMIEGFSCPSTVSCAGNALCDGTFVGPYAGASGTFILTSIVTAVMLLVELVLLWFVYSARRATRQRYGVQAFQPDQPPYAAPAGGDDRPFMTTGENYVGDAISAGRRTTATGATRPVLTFGPPGSNTVRV
jgi:hypothetical protein